jgi:cold shock CspA family protein
MASSSAVAVSASTITLVHTAKGSGIYPNSAAIQSTSTNGADVYVGGADVSVANGFKLTAGQSIAVDVVAGEKTYVFSTSVADIRVLEIAK